MEIRIDDVVSYIPLTHLQNVKNGRITNRSGLYIWSDFLGVILSILRENTSPSRKIIKRHLYKYFNQGINLKIETLSFVVAGEPFLIPYEFIAYDAEYLENTSSVIKEILFLSESSHSYCVDIISSHIKRHFR